MQTDDERLIVNSASSGGFVRQKRKFKVTFDEINHVVITFFEGPLIHGRASPCFPPPLSLSGASGDMLLAPTLALLALAFNFCALFHVTSNWSGPRVRRWYTLDRAIYALEEKTAAAYDNYLDIIAPPPLTSPPAYFPALHHAEWVYRSSAVRVLDLVDGSGDARTLSDIASFPLPPPSSTTPTGLIAFAGALPPTLPSLVDPATFVSFLTRDRATQLVATFSALPLLCLKFFIPYLTCTLAFAWLKVSRPHWQQLHPLLNAP
jgi:hypothetical protein